MNEWLLALPFFILLLAIPLALWMRQQGLTTAQMGWLLALFPLASLVMMGYAVLSAQGQPVAVSIPWAPAFDISFSLYLDGLSSLFALLILGIGALIVIYAGGYLGSDPNIGRFYAWLFLFMFAMLGVVLADNLLMLFIFWELTSLSSFLLIGYYHHEAGSRSAALQALLVTGGGGLAMLAGVVLLGQIGGTFEASALLVQGKALQHHPLFVPVLALILLGAFTKSAQFPFHFWLPNAMAAPTPVSAYLHSATMVKAGVYLLARLNPILGGHPIWLYAVGGVGAATMLVASVLAYSQTDLKRLLAYSTVAALGTLTLLIGLGSPLALKAAATFLLAHALYKGALFLVAGAVDHETGTRHVPRLGGLLRAMPLTATAAGLAALSMAGLPPLFGFIAKELVYESGLEAGPIWMAVALFMGLSTVFVAGMTGVAPFWAKPSEELPHSPHEASSTMWSGPLLLASVGLLTGLLPAGAAERIIGPAASSMAGQTIPVKLVLWHGITPAFLLSVVTVVVGTLLFAYRTSLRLTLQRLSWPWGPAYLYERSLDGLNALARFQTRLLQSGALRYYLLTIVLSVVVTVGWVLLRSGVPWVLPLSVNDVLFYEAALAVLILGATLAAILSPFRLGAIAALGVVGAGIALIYLMFGAPDLAITQFAIEALTVILFVLAFYHLPRFKNLSSPSVRRSDAVVALLTGSLMTLLVLVAVDVEISPVVSRFFAENALTKAYGRNVVNVILVDFRSLDTLGEITVLGVAGIGVYALLKFRKGRTKAESAAPSLARRSAQPAQAASAAPALTPSVPLPTDDPAEASKGGEAS